MTDGKYDTDVWIERVYIRQINWKPSKVKVTQGESTEQLEFKQPESDIIVIRKPGVKLTRDWVITIGWKSKRVTDWEREREVKVCVSENVNECERMRKKLNNFEASWNERVKEVHESFVIKSNICLSSESEKKNV